MKAKSIILYLISLFYLLPLPALIPNDPLYVTTREHVLWTDSLGTFSPKAVILISGANAHGRGWNDLFCKQFVDAGYFVIRFDHRDTGFSSASSHSFSIEDLADDIVAILQAYQLSEAHLIGHSMGGMVAQFVAANYPEYVKSMTLICSAPVGATPCLDRPISWTEMMTLTETLSLLVKQFQPVNFQQGYAAMFKHLQYFNGDYLLDEELATASIWDMFHHTNYPQGEGEIHIDNVQKLMKSLNRRRDIFTKIYTPSLIIHGDKDYLILPSRGGFALYEALQDSTLQIMPGMGHCFYHRGLIQELSSSILSFVELHESDTTR